MRGSALGLLVITAGLGGCGSSASSASPVDSSAPARDAGRPGFDGGGGSADASAHDGAIIRMADGSSPAQDATAHPDAVAKDGGTTSSDAHAALDAVADSSFGKVMGVDPCVGAGVGSAWSMGGRCLARPSRAGVVSSQTGSLLGHIHLTSQGYEGYGSIVFAADGTGYANADALGAFDPSSLALRWSLNESEEGPFLGPDGTLYFWSGTGDGVVLAETPTATGMTMKWTQQYATSTVHFSNYNPPPIILPDGTLVLAPEGVTLEAVSGADESAAWSTDLATVLGPYAYTVELVASSTGLIYALTQGIAAVSATTHAVVWSSPLTAYSGALDEQANLLYTIGPDPSQPAVVDQTSQNGTWVISTTPADVGGTAATVATFNDGCNGTCLIGGLTLGTEGWVYVSSGTTLYAFNAAPASKWSISGLNTVSSAVVGADGTVYLGYETSTGYWVEARTNDGQLRWKTEVSNAAPPNQGGGSTLSIDGHGYLYALFYDTSVLYQLGP